MPKKPYLSGGCGTLADLPRTATLSVEAIGVARTMYLHQTEVPHLILKEQLIASGIRWKTSFPEY
ncbi:UNVERIFIED_CONTAM: hypothetical protein Sradi_4406400 [Sesamum radiatum]|uniref:Uncharacterized protein n=1 Tax=Sesamum radiatum TaxID=300843 RepID=A0AAW2NRB8_SESRA